MNTAESHRLDPVLEGEVHAFLVSQRALPDLCDKIGADPLTQVVNGREGSSSRGEDDDGGWGMRGWGRGRDLGGVGADAVPAGVHGLRLRIVEEGDGAVVEPNVLDGLPPSQSTRHRIQAKSPGEILSFPEEFFLGRVEMETEREGGREIASSGRGSPELLGEDGGVGQPSAGAVAPVDLLELHRRRVLRRGQTLAVPHIRRRHDAVVVEDGRRGRHAEGASCCGNRRHHGNRREQAR